jgi:general secretion pathway protein E
LAVSSAATPATWAGSVIYEMLPLSESIKSLVTDSVDIDSLRRAGMKEGMRTLRLSGAQKVGAGLTTMNEVLRVVPIGQSR